MRLWLLTDIRHITVSKPFFTVTQCCPQAKSLSSRTNLQVLVSLDHKSLSSNLKSCVILLYNVVVVQLRSQYIIWSLTLCIDLYAFSIKWSETTALYLCIYVMIHVRWVFKASSFMRANIESVSLFRVPVQHLCYLTSVFILFIYLKFSTDI